MSAAQTATERVGNISSVTVIGAGQMGQGIAQVLAQSGFSTLLHDAATDSATRGLAQIKRRLERAVEKGALEASQPEEILARITVIDKLSGAKDSDVIIEAIIENEEIKFKLFRELDELCSPKTVFASNTSSISITKIAAATNRPEQVVGMHFMNPVPVMKLVELIRGLQTSDETYEFIKALTLAIDKTPVTARFDYPGFIVNRILIPMINEAAYALMEGIATPEEIDTAMTLGTNQPMGPLTLADFVGLDTVLAITRIFQREFGDDKYRACPLLVKHVEAGWVGKKAGRGFYRYDKTS